MFSCAATTYTQYESEYNPVSIKSDPILVTQAKLDHIVAMLELSQRKSEMWASFLNENNLLASNTKAYRNRNKEMQQFFTVNEEKTFAYCEGVGKLMKAMDIIYEKDDWRLFIDSSKNSLKAVLLHKLNEKPPIPIAYSTDTKETYDKMKYILELVQYKQHP
ncbi:unnamed protein product [Brassicogethes aeneus]|uniref:Uncharacterized protein n=1 Tax=Brassicogethes aeneus TaxID=1431903 RepID=A0A9P0B473_BRAAE|nr:unnamed protein product [Brassicogethes aeneus]